MFSKIPGLSGCGPAVTNNAILAFEFVRSSADVAALFGSEPCTSTLIAAQKTGLLLDGLGFIPLYCAFLIFGTAALAALGWPKWAGIAMIATAGLCDEIEGTLLRAILDALPGTPAVIGTLFWMVHIKFALLAAATLWIAILLLATRRLPAIAFGLVIGIGAMAAGIALLFGPLPVLTTGFAIGWISLLLTALPGAWRPSLFSPSAAPAVPPPAPASPSA